MELLGQGRSPLPEAFVSYLDNDCHFEQRIPLAVFRDNASSSGEKKSVVVQSPLSALGIIRRYLCGSRHYLRESP